MSAPALILFDIDGTLIRRAGPHHRQVLEDAVLRITGRPASTAPIPVQGMLDPDILTVMLRHAGAPPAEIRAAMPDIVRLAQSLYVRRCPDLRDRVCPGVRPLLNRLSRRALPLGLVTGNLSRIAWTKMRRAGLRDHFQFGAFAEAASTRTALARLAARHARAQGWIGSGALVTLIGDHPNDIAAARANGFRSVAVATGVVEYEDLAACGPDFLVTDLRSLPLETLLCP